MKVYVIKNKQLGYMTETRDFINLLYQAEFFDDYELAQCYCPTMTLCDCEVVEVQLMETKELAEHDKQVRKEVCEEIRKYIPRCSGMDMVIILDDTHTLNTILDQIQGDENNE